MKGLPQSTVKILKRSSRSLPKRLRPGQCVEVVAPSSGFDSQTLKKNVKWLNHFLKVTHAKTIQKKDLYLAHVDEHRAKHLFRALQSSETQAVFCARGGYGALRLLAKFKFPKTKKLFMGMSDVTLLLNKYTEKNNVVSVYGPVIAGQLFSQLSAFHKAFIFLQLSHPLQVMLEKSKDFVFLRKGPFQGELCGGNLATLVSSVGTPFEVQVKNKILFLEEVHEEPYQVDRMLCQWAMSGGFKNIKAVLLGDFTNAKGKQIPFNILKKIFFRFFPKVPIVAGLKCGHTHMEYVLPIGGHVGTDQSLEHIYISEIVS